MEKTRPGSQGLGLESSTRPFLYTPYRLSALRFHRFFLLDPAAYGCFRSGLKLHLAMSSLEGVEKSSKMSNYDYPRINWSAKSTNLIHFQFKTLR
jgi:hypothetical protein